MDESGVGCVNADDPYAAYLAEAIRGRALRFGRSADAEVRADAVEPSPEGARFDLHYAGRRVGVTLRAPGEHLASNALCAAALCIGYGVTDLDAIAAGLGRFHPGAHRGGLLRGASGCEIIDDCYNAAPDSVAAALRVLTSRPCVGRRVAVLGDMLELGEHAAAEHAEVGRLVVSSGVDALIAVGPLAASAAESAQAGGMDGASVHLCADTAEAARLAPQLVRAADVVLVKGSRGLALEKVVAALGGEA